MSYKVAISRTDGEGNKLKVPKEFMLLLVPRFAFGFNCIACF